MFRRGDKDMAFPQTAYYFTVPSYFTVLLFAFFGFIIQMLASFALGRKLLLRYPKLATNGVFSHEGPTQEQMDGCSFQFDMFATGYSSPADAAAGGKPDKNVQVRISGPEPGYVATPIIIAQAALTLLDEREDCPGGGVMMPAAAFKDTALVARLRRANIKFDVVKA